MTASSLLHAALLLLSGILPQGTVSQDNSVGQEVGTFKVTYYWIVFEEEFPGRPSVPLYDIKGKVLAVVEDRFAERVSMEGTGVMRDGRVLNLHNECDQAKYGWCFFLVDREKAPFGYGSHAPLHPFRTIAVPDHILKRGQVVYIPSFDGMPLPGTEGGFDFHDGCFVVEDTGWSLKGKHIDIFALSEEYYRRLHKQVDSTTHVNVFVDSPLCPLSSTTLYDPEAWARELLSE
jgi:3D (Asp-Asp-Asp) domain-containing protein